MRWWPSLRLVLLLGLFGVIAVLGTLVLAYRAIGIPTQEAAGVNAETSIVYYQDGSEMAELAGDFNRKPLEPAEIPESVKFAIVAAEDRTFYENRGISLTGIGRAVYGVVTGRDLGGGSTITQQYVKNVYGDDAPTYARKFREAIIALKLDQQLSKDEILARYLNTIYFGRRAYGIETAAEAYYGPDRTAQSLSYPEAALLVGLVPAPSAWDPRKDPEMAQERYDYVLNAMVETGTVTPADAAGSAIMPPTIEVANNNAYAGPNGYVLDQVRDELEEIAGISEDQIDTGGLRIETTIDPNMQRLAYEAVNDPDVLPGVEEGRPATLQAGLVSIDPGTGEVRAMYAGNDYLVRQQNALTDDIVQAGSTFKPFTLIAALEQDYSLRETLNGDSPRTFRGYTDGNGRPVPVNNYSREGAGTVDLVEATADSVNTAYVELNLEVGPEATERVAERAGLPDEAVEPNPSNVLGTSSVRPWDLAEAYATIAAQGVHHEAHVVRSVIDADGNLIYTAGFSVEPTFDRAVMIDATVALQAVVEDGSAARTAGRIDRPAAGKTGTSQDAKSAWFSGFTAVREDGSGGLATTVVLYNVADGSDPEVAANTQLEIPAFGGVRSITGGGYPASIWEAFMTPAMGDAEELEFPEPTRRSREAPTPTETEGSSESEESSEGPSPAETPTEEPSEEPSEPEPTEEPTEGEGEGDGGEEPTEGEPEPAPEDQADGGNGNGNARGQGQENGGGNGNG